MAMMEIVDSRIVIHEAKAKYELTSPALCSESDSRDECGEFEYLRASWHVISAQGRQRSVERSINGGERRQILGLELTSYRVMSEVFLPYKPVLGIDVAAGRWPTY
jgi:hypothetical protein